MIVLMGIKHCGKSTVGKALAEKLNYSFVDIDTLIEENCKKTVRQLYKEDGKEAFMQAEEAACKNLHHENGNLIVATGGGICDNQPALDALKAYEKQDSVQFVFLNADETTALDRILKEAEKTGSLPAYIQKENPASPDEVVAVFHKFYERRQAQYKKICSVHISVSNKTPDEICRCILAKN